MDIKTRIERYEMDNLDDLREALIDLQLGTKAMHMELELMRSFQKDDPLKPWFNTGHMKKQHDKDAEFHLRRAMSDARECKRAYDLVVELLAATSKKFA